LFFLLLAGGLAGYSFWIYMRVDLAVPSSRTLALMRAATLITVLILLFDVRVPSFGPGGAPLRWALLDASLSMGAVDANGSSPWDSALSRADELESDGWTVVRFGDGAVDDPTADGPAEAATLLAPALAAAAEAGASEVRVLSDLRFSDAVALRSALADIPVTVEFEGFAGSVVNAGIARFEVPDLARPDGSPTAEIEILGGPPGDSLTVEILEEGRVVAAVPVASASPGLRSRVSIDLPGPSTTGRVRYSARVSVPGDGFADDDEAVAFANIGHEEGALVLLSVLPDWEPRYLLPVLEDVTGLPAIGYMRAGPDRYVRVGHAIDRGAPVDSVDARRAAADASVLVVHGIGEDTEEWVAELVARPGRRLVLPADATGAGAVGVEVGAPRSGEWYVSPDVPTSPIAGALAGVALQGLPPLTSVMVPTEPVRQPALNVQLRGAGAPESAVQFLDRSSGRVVVTLSSGFWRWGMRENGREPYRRFWSGVVGWLLADRDVLTAEARPTSWVMARGAPVEWNVPGDSVDSRILVVDGDDVVIDTTVTSGGTVSTGPLPPAAYAFSVIATSGDTIGAGRFDVSTSTLEMLPVGDVPEVSVRNASLVDADATLGRPLRTFPWPYLLVIALLCVEWIVRRRTGLR
jgi:hypothetical protein